MDSSRTVFGITGGFTNGNFHGNDPQSYVLSDGNRNGGGGGGDAEVFLHQELMLVMVDLEL